MKPSQVAQALRHIASKIQNSGQPDHTLVARDLKKVFAAIRIAEFVWTSEVPRVEVLQAAKELGCQVGQEGPNGAIPVIYNNFTVFIWGDEESSITSNRRSTEAIELTNMLEEKLGVIFDHE